jgi:beta-lactamase regulating signal transducer with metallopeptidase domain
MENPLNQITNYLLTQSWQIAILVIVIAAASWLLKNKSAHVRYLLWLIVLAKCLVPPLFTIPLAVLPQEKPTLLLQLQAPPPMIAEPATSPAPPQVSPPVPVVVQPRPRLDMRQWLSVGWIVGLSIFALVALIKAWRTLSWLRRQRRPLPAELKAAIERLFCERGALPKLWLIEGAGQPFVWGLFRGSIYLPADFVKTDNAEYRRGILGHELSHIMRFDAAVNCLQVIAQAIFWFHPFVWWANKKIRAEREKCCDEMAIARLGAKVKDYSIAIVNILLEEHESTRPVPSLAVAGPVKNVEERIKTMLRPGKKFYKRPSSIAATAVLMLALVTVPTAVVLTARGETKAPTEPAKKPTKSLHQVAADGDIKQVKSTISKGTDVNAKDRMGKTALYRAAEKGQPAKTGAAQEDFSRLLDGLAAGYRQNDRQLMGKIIQQMEQLRRQWEACSKISAEAPRDYRQGTKKVEKLQSGPEKKAAKAVEKTSQPAKKIAQTLQPGPEKKAAKTVEKASQPVKKIAQTLQPGPEKKPAKAPEKTAQPAKKTP